MSITFECGACGKTITLRSNEIHACSPPKQPISTGCGQSNHKFVEATIHHDKNNRLVATIFCEKCGEVKEL